MEKFKREMKTLISNPEILSTPELFFRPSHEITKKALLRRLNAIGLTKKELKAARDFLNDTGYDASGVVSNDITARAMLNALEMEQTNLRRVLEAIRTEAHLFNRQIPAELTPNTTVTHVVRNPCIQMHNAAELATGFLNKEDCTFHTEIVNQSGLTETEKASLRRYLNKR